MTSPGPFEARACRLCLMASACDWGCGCMPGVSWWRLRSGCRYDDRVPRRQGRPASPCPAASGASCLTLSCGEAGRWRSDREVDGGGRSRTFRNNIFTSFLMSFHTICFCFPRRVSRNRTERASAS